MNNDQNNQVPEYMFKMDFDKYEKPWFYSDDRTWTYNSSFLILHF